MAPDVALTEGEIARHNDLYARANELTEGLLLLDGVPRKPLGFFQKRRLRKATALHQQVLQINPANWQAMFVIGKIHQRLGDLEEALSWFLRANERQPENPSLAKEVGSMAGQLGKHEIALRVLESVMLGNRGDVGLQVNFGLSCLMIGRSGDACKAFERAVELEPQQAVNKKLLTLAKEVEAGKRPRPGNEREIARAISS